MPGIELRFFGPPQVACGSKVLPVQRRKSLALLAYLAVTRHAHARAALATLLWPDLDQARGHTVLRSVLADLRQALGHEQLATEGDQVMLAGGPGITADVVRFRELVAQVAAHHPARGSVPHPLCDVCLAALADAAALYRGDFLVGFTLADAVEFDAWQTLQTETLRLELAGVLEKLAAGLADRGQYDDALGQARRWLALDGLNEAAHRLLIEIYARSGDRAAAARQYRECVRLLQDELGVEPEAATTACYEAVRAGAATEPSPTPPPSHAAAAVPRLPPDLTPFIGRRDELRLLAERLADPACRLLTVFGPGGMGKTRLAIQAARSAGGQFSQGVCFVDLAPVLTADLLSTAILQALPALQVTTAPDQYVLDYLAGKQMLLVLDNYEHLLSGPESDRRDGYGLVTKLVSAAPQVKLLITSRSRLNVTAEWLAPLEGLKTPGETAADLEHYSATALFLACVRRIRPHFQPTAEDARLIGRISRLLGGMPLGIELAAAWTRTLALAEIAHELEHGLELLQSTARDVTPRHRSMTVAFDHSWALLSPRQRSIMRQLAVFRGDFDRAAAQAVAGASLADLTGLADASWLRLDAGSRLQMHILTQQYCAARLAAEHERETGESADRVHDRHAAYYASLILPRWIEFARTGAMLTETAQDLHNTLAAWEWALGQRDLPTIWTLSCGLGWLSDRLAVHRLGANALAAGAAALQSLAAHDPAAAPVRAICLIAGSERLARLGLLADAAASLEEAAALLGATDPGVTHWCEVRFYYLRMAGWLKVYGADSGEATRLFRTALAELERGDCPMWPYVDDIARSWLAEVYWALAFCALLARRHAEARALAEQSIAVCEQYGLTAFLPYAVRPLVHALIHQGDFPQAEARMVAALDIAQRNGDQVILGGLLLLAGRVYFAWGKWESAQAYARRGLQCARATGTRDAEAAASRLLGDIARAQGDGG